MTNQGPEREAVERLRVFLLSARTWLDTRDEHARPGWMTAQLSAAEAAVDALRASRPQVPEGAEPVATVNDLPGCNLISWNGPVPPVGTKLYVSPPTSISAGWRTDFDAEDIQDYPIIVYATDDQGYSYGLGSWRHDKGEVTLYWAGLNRPINDGIERALCWKHLDYPGRDSLDGLAAAPSPTSQSNSKEKGNG